MAYYSAGFSAGGPVPFTERQAQMRFIDRWGSGVTWQHRIAMGTAWARCATGDEPVLPTVPLAPTEDAAFTASASMQDGGPRLGRPDASVPQSLSVRQAASAPKREVGPRISRPHWNRCS